MAKYNSLLLLSLLAVVGCAPQINGGSTDSDDLSAATPTPTATATSTTGGDDDDLYGPGTGNTGVSPYSFGPYITHGKTSGKVHWSSKTHLPSDQSLFVSDGRLHIRFIPRSSPGQGTDVDGSTCQYLALPYTKLTFQVSVRAHGTDVNSTASAEALAAKALAESTAAASEAEAEELRADANELLEQANTYQALADQYTTFANTVGISTSSKNIYKARAASYQAQADTAMTSYNTKNAEATLAEAQATIDRAEADAAAAEVGSTSVQYLDQRTVGPVAIDTASDVVSLSVPENSTSEPFIVEVTDTQWDWNCIQSGGSGYGCPMNQVNLTDCIKWEIQMATSWTNDFSD